MDPYNFRRQQLTMEINEKSSEIQRTHKLQVPPPYCSSFFHVPKKLYELKVPILKPI